MQILKARGAARWIIYTYYLKTLNKYIYLICKVIYITNMTLALPEDLYEIMQKHKEIKWSEIARQAIWDKARKLELMDKILSKSKLTEEDALEMGRKVNKQVAKRHRAS